MAQIENRCSHCITLTSHHRLTRSAAFQAGEKPTRDELFHGCNSMPVVPSFQPLSERTLRNITPYSITVFRAKRQNSRLAVIGWTPSSLRRAYNPRANFSCCGVMTSWFFRKVVQESQLSITVTDIEVAMFAAESMCRRSIKLRMNPMQLLKSKPSDDGL